VFLTLCGIIVLSSDGNRFNLRFSPEGLNGNNWNWNEDANSDVGCFLLMM